MSVGLIVYNRAGQSILQTSSMRKYLRQILTSLFFLVTSRLRGDVCNSIIRAFKNSNAKIVRLSETNVCLDTQLKAPMRSCLLASKLQ